MPKKDNATLDSNLKDPHADGRVFTVRVIFSLVVVMVCLGLVVSRLMYLQVHQGEHFRTLSEGNRVRVEPLPPMRGLIYDRNGILLADNAPYYSLEIIPGKVRNINETISKLSQIIPITEVDMQRFQRLLAQRRRFDGVPIRVDLNEEERARFAVRSHHFSGVEIRAELLRHYPYPQETAHALGYVGRINQDEMARIDTSNYAGTSHIGKVGVEKAHEDTLHGEVGYQQVEVNARGRVLRTLHEKPPTAGRDLHLFLDLELQQDATAAMAGFRGSVVAIDPNTGGVLAMVSSPSFNPNLFVSGISATDFNALRDSIDRPLYNRAVRGQYPPASTIKPFIALGGLAHNHISVNSAKYCGGYYQLPGHSHRYRCWRRTGHGMLRMEDAVVQSCDVYFYRLAQEMGIERLGDVLAPFGFGELTGIDFADELGGILPSPEWKMRTRRQPWFPGETLIVGIGQGTFLSTPLQLAVATAAIANRGSFIQPRMVAATHNTLTDKLEPTTPVIRKITLGRPQDWDAAISSMEQVVHGPRGTARRIINPHYRIAGKTGTAQVFTIPQGERYIESQVPERLRNHALFIAFAPIENPQIAVAVIVENGRQGGAVAAPIAGQVIASYLLNQRVDVVEKKI